jgi:hypothetical protein
MARQMNKVKEFFFIIQMVANKYPFTIKISLKKRIKVMRVGDLQSNCPHK